MGLVYKLDFAVTKRLDLFEVDEERDFEELWPCVTCSMPNVK